MKSLEKTKSAAVREKLNHPVIDGDGHMVEYLPLAMQYVRDVAGQSIYDRWMARFPAATRNYDGGPERIGGNMGWYGLTKQQRHDMRVTRGGFWSLPVKTLDRATMMLPNLFRERMDQLGLDYAIVYPTAGLEIQREASDDQLRLGVCRSYNTMYADLYRGHADRMAVAAIIPSNTPEEALAEIDWAVEHGFKVVMIGSTIRRPIAEIARKAPELSPYATWMDVLAISSEYDYDPVWQKCMDHKLAVTAHNGSRGFGFRNSPDNFVYNHIGHFAAANEAFCKALVMGGVVRRFPKLTFAFLEGGAGWACNLYNDIIEHWETRNMKAMREYLDPAKLDRNGLTQYFKQYGDGRFEVDSTGIPIQTQLVQEKLEDLDDFRELQIEDPREFAKIFENFYFGCEAEDRMTAVAFNRRLNHFGAKLQAIFSSDVGHFDVRDITRVVADAYELVEDDLLSEDDFRSFTFANVVRLFGKMDPSFFDGTSVESEARAALAE